MSKSLKIVLGLVVIAAAVAVAVSFSTKRESSLSEPMRIGLIAPLTGDAAVYGEPLSNVVRLAVGEINNEGGIDGRMLEVIYEDGKCNGKDAASAMQKLASIDKVQVVIGGFCSSESLAAQPIAEQAKVFLFSPGSSSPDLTGISPYFVRNYPSDASQGTVLADIAYDDRGWKKVAFIQEQLDYPLGIYKAFASRFEEKGGMIAREEFPTQTTDFRSLLTKLRAANPDALFVDTQTPAAADRVLKQVQELLWDVPILVSDATAGDAETVKKNATILEDGLAAEFGTDPENKKFQYLLAAYQTRFGAEVPYQSYAQTMYDAVYMLRDAFKDVGYNGELMTVWFRMVRDWDGASGKIAIGQDGDRVGGHTPKVIRDGHVELYKK